MSLGSGVSRIIGSCFSFLFLFRSSCCSILTSPTSTWISFCKGLTTSWIAVLIMSSSLFSSLNLFCMGEFSRAALLFFRSDSFAGVFLDVPALFRRELKRRPLNSSWVLCRKSCVLSNAFLRWCPGGSFC